jgi:hypothetical protein
MLKTNSPWEKLNPDDAKRVSIKGHFDFFWVVLEDSLPALMLKLPVLPDPMPKLPKLKNIDASFRSVSGGSAFVLCLNERSQINVFETLCKDVVEVGEVADNIGDALSRSILRTYRWHHLLRGGNKAGLSVEEQRGLIGELSFLRKLISAFGPETAIEAWTGPSGSAKDFEFIGTCVEVKTRRAAARPFISISSAEQLEDVDGCKLFLWVASVASAVSPEGKSLHDYVSMTARYFEHSVKAFDQWEEAIYSSGYDQFNDYDNRRWHLDGIRTYEIVEGFPRIPAPLPYGIEAVRYSLSLDACSAFEINKDLMLAIREGFNNV